LSFETLNKDVLVQVADEFAVDLTDKKTKAKIVTALEEDGVTWAMYQDAFPSVEDQPDAEPADGPAPVSHMSLKPAQPNVLLRMKRMNPTYETRGYRFTRENPFLPVDVDAANWILENEEGFAIASPREAEEFYS
jgi:hypothetical protein